MLVSSIFSFSHNVFYPIKDRTFILSSANAFNLVTSKILSLSKKLRIILPHESVSGETQLLLLTLYSINAQIAFENVGKEEIAHKEQFLHFPQCFLLISDNCAPFVHIFDTISLFAGEFEEPKIGKSAKGLTTLRNVTKGENADNQHFLLFHNILYPIKRQI